MLEELFGARALADVSLYAPRHEILALGGERGVQGQDVNAYLHACMHGYINTEVHGYIRSYIKHKTCGERAAGISGREEPEAISVMAANLLVNDCHGCLACRGQLINRALF